MKNFRIYSLLLTFVFLWSASPIDAQSNRDIACVAKTAWLIDGGQALKLGECTSIEWFAPLGLEQLKDQSGSASDERARQALLWIKAIGQVALKPIPLNKTKVESHFSQAKLKEPIVLEIQSLPLNVRQFFERQEQSPASQVFVLTSGTWFVTEHKYDEFERYLVRVPGVNPTINDILQALKVYLPDNSPSEGELPVAFENRYLSLPWKEEGLDSKKTVADYKINNGAILWILERLR